jgi:LysM repeat protein
MPPEKQVNWQWNEDMIAALLADAFPSLRVHSPLREDLARRLRLEVAHRGERAQANLLSSLWHGALGLTRALVVVGVLAAVVVVSTLTILPYLRSMSTEEAVSATALLEVQSGTVSVRSGGTLATLGEGESRSLKDGDLIESESGSALITYSAGQTTKISAQTQLEIVQMATHRQNVTTVLVRVLQGATLNRVSKALLEGSSFTIASPSLSASVHGTEFRMVVMSPNQTYVAADQGTVEVESGGQTAMIRAGEQLVAVAGQDMQVTSQPALQATWTVRPGDTLWKIASHYGLAAQDLAAANPWIGNPDLILPGWTVSIPKK